MTQSDPGHRVIIVNEPDPRFEGMSVAEVIDAFTPDERAEFEQSMRVIGEALGNSARQIIAESRAAAKKAA